MKKTLITIGLIGSTFGAFAQGTVLFENYNGNGNVVFQAGGNQPAGNAALGSYTVALLYNPQASGTVDASLLTQIAVYSPSSANGDVFAGAFSDPTTITTPSGSGTGIFEVVGWVGNFSTWAAASAQGSGATYLGQSGEFINAMGNPAATPAGTPVGISGNGGGWNGNLTLVPVPEPTTIALGGLGAAALLAFRRRK